MHNHFRVEVRHEERATILAVAGELDLATSPAFADALEHAAAEQTDVLILDLSELAFMDSTGLSLVVSAHQRARETGRRFGVAGGSDQVQRLMRITGLSTVLPLTDSVDELLEEQ